MWWSPPRTPAAAPPRRSRCDKSPAHHLPAPYMGHGGCTGSLVEYRLVAFAPVPKVVKGSDGQRGFVVLHKRWIVQRFLAHLMRTRLLARPPPARA
ncbi:hypothetical protein ACJ6WE_37700 [Streptomyces sp. MMS24-I31]|uniref:hypothetical protein n=1 Tax=Streptomyces sp. MMS24-I31 TaxID=3351563 RepID=UPI003896C00F